MVQTKQELIDSLKAQNEGAERELESLRNDTFNAGARGHYIGAISARTGLINQLTRELEEEGDNSELARRKRLESALRAYYGNDYLLNWVAIAEITNPELEQERKTIVTYSQGVDQSFASTRGLLDIALHADRTRS